MSTSTAAQTTLSIIKDEFTEVITEGTLSPTNKPSDWNVVITEKAILNAMRIPSPPPGEIWCGLATLYDTTFSTAEDYQKFTVNCLALWGNTMEYKYFDAMYMAHQTHACTIKKLCEQAMALLEEANRINNWDLLTWQEIECHVGQITRFDLHQQIKKPQRVQTMIFPTPLSGPSWCPVYLFLDITHILCI
jgi:hypothetical protein